MVHDWHLPDNVLLSQFLIQLHFRGTNTTTNDLIRNVMVKSSHEAVRSELGGHLARLWRYGLVLSGSRESAEDLVQATCLRALERADQFTPGTRLDRWLMTILHRTWLNELRAARYRRGQGLVDAESALVFDGLRALETNISAAQVLSNVQALPEAQREAVFLVYVEGYTYREAAEIFDVPIGTIMSRLAAARAKLVTLQESRPVDRRVRP